MTRVFLVDLDDTLLDFRRAERENLILTLQEYAITADEALIARYHEINDSLWKALERGEITREKLRGERFRRLFREFGILRDGEEVGRTFWRNFPEICYPFEGSAEFLSRLKACGRVYAVTNGGERIQFRHIELAGFAPWLDGVFISETLGCEKPSRAFAECVMAGIPGFSLSEAVWLGDSRTADEKCAREAGIRFVLYAPRGVPKDYSGEAATDYREAFARMTS